MQPFTPGHGRTCVGATGNPNTEGVYSLLESFWKELGVKAELYASECATYIAANHNLCLQLLLGPDDRILRVDESEASKKSADRELGLSSILASINI